MDAEKFWSTTEMNKFLYQQLKTMCEANGFVLSPRKGKHLVKIAEHFVKIVWPEISYNRTRIHVLVSPAGSYKNHIYAEKLSFDARSEGTQKIISKIISFTE